MQLPSGNGLHECILFAKSTIRFNNYLWDRCAKLMTNGPTLAGFNTFVYDVALINPLYLPVGSPVIGYAYDVALSVVNTALVVVRSPPGEQWSPYARAVYNLGMSNIVNYAQDQPGRTYFTDLRRELGIAKFQAGVVSSTGDQSTSVALLNPEFMRTMTLANLQQIKDPWGRAYLQAAQDYGTLWGLTT